MEVVSVGFGINRGDRVVPWFVLRVKCVSRVKGRVARSVSGNVNAALAFKAVLSDRHGIGRVLSATAVFQRQRSFLLDVVLRMIGLCFGGDGSGGR